MSKGGETVLEHLKSCVIVCGHYGAGKTNLTVNLALAAAQSGEAVSVIDMDIVNPYFRTADFQELFREAGIQTVGAAPQRGSGYPGEDRTAFSGCRRGR